MSNVKPHTHQAGLAERAALGVIKRIYAIGVIVLVGWLSYAALRYLVVTLMIEQPPPRQITAIPKHLTAEVLSSRRTKWEGVQVTAHPRVPPEHYHQLEGWYQPDRFNGCTTSGCHQPLPHSRDKATRAFLNMHATSIHCGVCHLAPATPQPNLTWYSLDNGRPTGVPALLALYGLLTSEEGRRLSAAPTAEFQGQLVALLQEATAQADQAPALAELVDEIAAPRYTSPQFQAAVTRVLELIPRHFRGEYDAKLALSEKPGGLPRLRETGNDDAVREFKRQGLPSDPAAREALVKRIHPQLRAETLTCTSCHRTEGSLVDLGQVGYPPARIQRLHEGWIFRAIEDIAAGRPLRLPSFMTPTPATAPGGAGEAP